MDLKVRTSSAIVEAKNNSENRGVNPLLRLVNQRLVSVAEVFRSEGGTERDFLDIAKTVGVTEEELAETGRWIGVTRLAQVMELCSQFLEDRAFGVKVALLQRREEGNLMTFIARSCSTIGDAISMAQRFYRLEDRDTLFKVSEAKGYPVIILDNTALAPGDYPTFREAYIFGFAKRLRMLSERSDWGIVIHIRERERETVNQFAKLAGAEVIGGKSQYALQLPKQAMGCPIPSANTALLTHLVKHGETLLDTQEETPMGFSQKVHEVIKSQLPGRVLKAEEVASILGMTHRTLSRRLADEQTNFRHLTDTTRCELAKRMIKRGESLASVAFFLDFSDQSGFSVAFKKWTGSTPGHYRRSAK